MQELSKLRKEKDELHLQYAREIEAAHAQVGVRETELIMQHTSYIQEMQQQHEKGILENSTLCVNILFVYIVLLELRTEHERFCEQLRCDLISETDHEKQSLNIKHQNEMMKLKDDLTKKDVCLAKLRTELSDALMAVDERGKGLGAVESVVEKLKREIKMMTEKERDANSEIKQLKVKNSDMYICNIQEVPFDLGIG